MLEFIGQILIILSAIWLIAISTLMLINPKQVSIYFKKAGSTNIINYTEITLRFLFGISLFLFSQQSKFPEFFNIFGLIIISTSIVLFFLPRKLHARYAVWSVTIIEPYFRFFAPLSFVLGIFLIYAVI